VSWPSVTPVPDSGTFSAELDAFDAMARLPDKAPAEVGEKVALKLTLWPGLNVIGKVTPLALKPEVAPIVETVTLAPPEFVSVSARVCELPSGMLPNPRLAGPAVSWPALTPVPDNGTVTEAELL